MKGFWEDIKLDGILKQPQVIMGEDLKFTFSSKEIRGHRDRLDLLS